MSRPHRFSVNKIGEIKYMIYLKNYRYFSNIPKVVGRRLDCMVRMYCRTRRFIHRVQNVKQFLPFSRFGIAKSRDILRKVDYSVIEEKRSYIELSLWIILSERVIRFLLKMFQHPRSIEHFSKS
jgi:hypothetical protein